jgi:DnaJ-class molecular chaperone
MSEAAADPYAVLGVAHDVSDIELRRVYRGLVKRYHPDHNGGSAESATRFAQIQNAYDQIAHNRASPQHGAQQAYGATGATGGTGAAGGTRATGGTSAAADAQHAASEPDIEDRIASLEREMAAMREAERRRAEEQVRVAREKVRQAAARGAATGSNQGQGRPTPEELGYYTTDDSFTKIVDDAAGEFTERLRKSDAKKQFSRRLSDLFGRDE